VVFALSSVTKTWLNVLKGHSDQTLPLLST